MAIIAHETRVLMQELINWMVIGGWGDQVQRWARRAPGEWQAVKEKEEGEKGGTTEEAKHKEIEPESHHWSCDSRRLSIKQSKVMSCFRMRGPSGSTYREKIREVRELSPGELHRYGGLRRRKHSLQREKFYFSDMRRKDLRAVPVITAHCLSWVTSS